MITGMPVGLAARNRGFPDVRLINRSRAVSGFGGTGVGFGGVVFVMVSPL
jgi:hypothetical protein